MDQHRLPDVSSEYQKRRQVVARICDAYGGLPRLFAVPLEEGTTLPPGTVVAWGIELPDGTAITCDPAGSAFGTWGSAINAAAMIGGVQPLYLVGPEAWARA